MAQLISTHPMSKKLMERGLNSLFVMGYSQIHRTSSAGILFKIAGPGRSRLQQKYWNDLLANFGKKFLVITTLHFLVTQIPQTCSTLQQSFAFHKHQQQIYRKILRAYKSHISPSTELNPSSLRSPSVPYMHHCYAQYSQWYCCLLCDGRMCRLSLSLYEYTS